MDLPDNIPPGANIDEEAAPLPAEQLMDQTSFYHPEDFDFSLESSIREPLKDAVLTRHKEQQSQGDKTGTIIDFSEAAPSVEALSDDDLEFVNAAGVDDSSATRKNYRGPQRDSVSDAPPSLDLDEGDSRNRTQ